MSEVEAQLSFLGREFKPWRYGVSLRKLFFRSNKTIAKPTRIEIAFWGVCGLYSPPPMEFSDLIVERVNREVKPDFIHYQMRQEQNLYRLLCSRGIGWVIARSVHAREDNLLFNEASSFDEKPWGGTDLGSL